MFYELTIILGGNLDEKRRGMVIERIKKLVNEAGGSIEEEKEWGKRELAYPVKKQREGVYYFYMLNLDADRISALSRVLENDVEVLRHMVIKEEKSKSSVQVQDQIEETKKPKNQETEKVAAKKVSAKRKAA